MGIMEKKMGATIACSSSWVDTGLPSCIVRDCWCCAGVQENTGSLQPCATVLTVEGPSKLILKIMQIDFTRRRVDSGKNSNKT